MYDSTKSWFMSLFNLKRPFLSAKMYTTTQRITCDIVSEIRKSATLVCVLISRWLRPGLEEVRKTF